MRILRGLGQWDGKLRLAWVVCTGALFMTLWVLQQAGSWPTRIWGAALAAFAPIVVAWPFLARGIPRPARRAQAYRPAESLSEVDLLRRAGAI